MDSRCKVTPATEDGAVAANAASTLATGEFVAFLEPDDRLPQQALYEVAAELERHPDADLLYVDEDFCNTKGRRHSPYFKPDWDPDLALGQDLLGQFCLMRLDQVRALGGLRAEFDPAAIRELHLRLADAVDSKRIRHIPAVLCHRSLVGSEPREMASTAYIEAAREAVRQRCLTRDPGVVSVEAAPRCPFWNRVVREVPEPAPLVSVIVPTRDHAQVLGKCAKGVLHRTRYESLELIIMDNDSVEPATTALFEELRSDPRVRIIPSPGAFNFSAICNRGVAAATGAIILLLNNDIEIPNPDWLAEMVSHAVRPEIGAVGARLLYPNGLVQHAGIVLLPLPGAYHGLKLSRGDDPGYFGQLALTRSCEAVTGACLALRRALFLEVGGFNDRDLAVTYNDTDLCLRLSRRGYRNICTPFSELIHVESLSRGRDRGRAKKARVEVELAFTAASAPEKFANDRYHNSNLDYACDEGVLLAKPRRQKPWQRSRGQAAS
jgi:GT2 family glycosyltransferase